jgi:hypothetical protein
MNDDCTRHIIVESPTAPVGEHNEKFTPYPYVQKYINRLVPGGGHLNKLEIATLEAKRQIFSVCHI